MPHRGKVYGQMSASPGTDSVLSLELRGFWVRVRTAWGNPVPEKLFRWLGGQVPQNQGMSQLENHQCPWFTGGVGNGLSEGSLTWAPWSDGCTAGRGSPAGPQAGQACATGGLEERPCSGPAFQYSHYTTLPSQGVSLSFLLCQIPPWSSVKCK